MRFLPVSFPSCVQIWDFPGDFDFSRQLPQGGGYDEQQQVEGGGMMPPPPAGDEQQQQQQQQPQAAQAAPQQQQQGAGGVMPPQPPSFMEITPEMAFAGEHTALVYVIDAQDEVSECVRACVRE